METDKLKKTPPICEDKNITSPTVAGTDLSECPYRSQISHAEKPIFAKLIPQTMVKTYKYSRLLFFLNFIWSIVVFNLFLAISNKMLAIIPCMIADIIGWAITDNIVSRSMSNSQSTNTGNDKAA